MKVVVIGNVFWGGGPEIHHFSTESDYIRSLESMGHQVVPVQESPTLDGAELMIRIRVGQPDFVLWVHSPGWEWEGKEDFIRFCQVPTIGLHLDLWRGLTREPMVGKHSFFRQSLVLTADGGAPDGWWEERGVRHVWSPPGILEASCYLAEPDPALAYEIIFVGSRGYHPEHPRAELIEWLQATYGERFKLFEHSSGMREHRLNQLYATAKCVVGDSCFAGKSSHARYWSDRLPESLGRGARLVFPRIDGLPDDVPCRLFEASDRESLRAAIDETLADPPDVAMEQRKRAVSWALAGQTYRHRIERVLEVMRERGLLPAESAVEADRC